jgi:hypothetical protein
MATVVSSVSQERFRQHVAPLLGRRDRILQDCD